MGMNDEIERIWDEAVMDYFKALSKCLFSGTLKNYKKNSDRIILSRLRYEGVTS
jgi:hypothetical protein